MKTSSLARALRAHVERLAAKPRPPGTEEHRQARTYIGQQLEEAGFSVTAIPREEAGFRCVNLVSDALPDDRSLPLVVLGAHYDSVIESPGADDNASAVASLLEVARRIRPQLDRPLHARLQLVAYDLEEYGLVGSSLHSGELERSRVAVRGIKHAS